MVVRHQFLAFALTAAVCALGALLAFVRPSFRPDTLSYRVAYTEADARRAFAAAGLPLVTHTATDLSTADLRVEVDVFGDPRKLAAVGSPGVLPRRCGDGAANAARWRENVRVVVSCAHARPGDLRRAARALALLP